MTRLAANLSWLFTDAPLPDRYRRAAEAGFVGVELNFPYDEDAAVLAARSEEHGLRHVLINAPPGDWSVGERGLAAIPDRREEFDEALALAGTYATALQCPLVHILAGRRDDGAELPTLVENLRRAVDVLGAQGVGVVLETLNPRDFPGYLVDRPSIALDVLERVPGLGLQADLYHLQICRGDLTQFLSDNLGDIAHVQIASVPDRGVPDHGETDSTYLLSLLDDLGYTGWIGCEYRPRTNTAADLDWARPYLSRPHA